MFCLFSPDLTQYLDFEIATKEFVIRTVPTGVIRLKLPRNFLATPSSTKQVTEQLKFMTWVDNETLRIIDISHDEPFEKLIKTSALNTGAFVEVESSSTIPYFDITPYTI